MVPNQVSIGKSVFAATVSQSLHRSALFLLAFLVVHLFGNMAVFFGPEVFNGYGHKLRHNPLLLVVEYYLLAAVVVHAIAAGFGTWRKRKMIAKKPAANGKLMFSAIVVTAFLVTHLLDLRFGSEELKYTQADGSLTRDLYSLQLSLFQNKGRVLWYLVAIAAVGIHLLVGWEKTVPKVRTSELWVGGDTFSSCYGVNEMFAHNCPLPPIVALIEWMRRDTFTAAGHG